MCVILSVNVLCISVHKLLYSHSSSSIAVYIHGKKSFITVGLWSSVCVCVSLCVKHDLSSLLSTSLS